MAHPFEKMLQKALDQSTIDQNRLLEKAEELKDKGYNPKEIFGLLEGLSKGLIDPQEAAIAAEAAEEFSEYLP